MTEPTVTTPSRLHFGLLALGPQAPRQFGGIGLMIERPGLAISARPSTTWDAAGPLAARVLRFAEVIATSSEALGESISPARFRILRAPPEHVGLGTGTQLGLAVARLLTCLAGRPEIPATHLAALSGRGRRSGIGLHGFALGGLLVDGGRRPTVDEIPPLLSRHAWPESWSVLLVIPRTSAGLHGQAEVQAFARLKPIADSLTDRLCRLVLLGMLPAVVLKDLAAFDDALTELQRLVGETFAPIQGGAFAHGDSAPLVSWLRSQGLRGVGQSSWGPTLYGFLEADEAEQRSILERFRSRFGLDPSRVFWTRGQNSGSSLSPG